MLASLSNTTLHRDLSLGVNHATNVMLQTRHSRGTSVDYLAEFSASSFLVNTAITVSHTRGGGLRGLQLTPSAWAVSGLSLPRVLLLKNSGVWVSRRSRFVLSQTRRFFSWAISSLRASSTRTLRSTTLAFGPQHPAAHGILKLVFQLQGELLRHVDPQFGFLHRGTEKLMENRSFLQSLPYFDRFDYVANLTQEHAYCAALEALSMNSVLPAVTQIARALFDELSRLLNHLLTLSATALDMSVMGPIF